MPVEIPSLPQEFFSELDRLSLPVLSFQVARAFLGGAIDEQELEQIVFDCLGMDAPLAAVPPGVFGLELFHGPTLEFKVFGGRFIARTLDFITSAEDRESTRLATNEGKSE